jgi:TRAP-type C4-dicarboxylate transport system permease large subunit
MELIVPFALVSYFGLLIGVPFGILGVFLHRVRILKHNWKAVLAKSMGAIAVWLLLSFAMMFAVFIVVYSGAHTPSDARVRVMAVLIFLAVIISYGLAGWGLCYLLNRRATNSEEPS